MSEPIKINLIKGTLRDASKDDNGGYLLDSGDEEVYLFDDIAELVGCGYRKNKKVKSVDAVVQKNNGEKIYFIEFKNTPHSHMPKNELFYKAHDSVFPYLLAFEPDISLEKFKEKAFYIVVYNDNAPCRQREIESSSINNFKHKMRTYSKVSDDIHNIRWGLEVFEKNLYKKVYTVDKEVFSSSIKPKIWN